MMLRKPRHHRSCLQYQYQSMICMPKKAPCTFSMFSTSSLLIFDSSFTHHEDESHSESNTANFSTPLWLGLTRDLLCTSVFDILQNLLIFCNVTAFYYVFNCTTIKYVAFCRFLNFFGSFDTLFDSMKLFYFKNGLYYALKHFKSDFIFIFFIFLINFQLFFRPNSCQSFDTFWAIFFIYRLHLIEVGTMEVRKIMK